MHFSVFGLNHNTAPVDVRERLFVCEDDTVTLLEKLGESGFESAVILSTCNRTEIYYVTESIHGETNRLRQLLSGYFRANPSWLTQYAYEFHDEDAFRHLFLVASGLDSMVIGEPQILGQVKDAYRTATLANSTGFYLDKVFHRAFRVAKRIRTETRIGYNPVSISSMAVELSKKIFGDLAEKKILVIGAGEMCEIALKSFKKNGIQEITITNRTFQSAQKLAEEIIGSARPFDDIPELLTKVDMVLTSTGSDHPIIDKTIASQVMKTRKGKPLFFIDIAVPRDVDPRVNDIENVYLYDIDDLKELSQKHLVDRMKEAQKAQDIVAEELEKFSRWSKQLYHAPVISHIVSTIEEMRSNEVKKAMGKLKNIDQDTAKSIDLLTRSIVNKILHPHLSAIKEQGDSKIVDIIKKLFQYTEDDEEEKDL